MAYTWNKSGFATYPAGTMLIYSKDSSHPIYAEAGKEYDTLHYAPGKISSQSRPGFTAYEVLDPTPYMTSPGYTVSSGASPYTYIGADGKTYDQNGNVVSGSSSSQTQTTPSSATNNNSTSMTLPITYQGKTYDLANPTDMTAYQAAINGGTPTPAAIPSQGQTNPNSQWITYQGTQYNLATPDGMNAYQSAINGGSSSGLTGQLQGVLDNLSSQGLTINPNKELGPSDVAEFLKKAESEIAPYYADQLKIGREQYLRSQGYDTDTILKTEKDLETKYGTSLRTLQSNAAEQGFAQSGMRTRDENQLAQDTQNQIDQGRSQLAYNAGTRALDFASKYGSTNLPYLNISGAPTVSSGDFNFNRTGNSNSLYNVSSGVLDNIIGSQQQEQATSARNLAQFYETQARSLQTIPQYSSPTSTTISSTVPTNRTLPSQPAPTPAQSQNYSFLPGETVDQYKQRFPYLLT